MRHEYQVKYPDIAYKIKFYIGDVRSFESCRRVISLETRTIIFEAKDGSYRPLNMSEIMEI